MVSNSSRQRFRSVELTWLTALALHEGIEGGEGGLAELCRSLAARHRRNESLSYRLRPFAAAVDELGDRIRVVDKCGRQGGLRKRVAVVGDQGFEVEGRAVRVLSGHAGRAASLVIVP